MSDYDIVRLGGESMITRLREMLAGVPDVPWEAEHLFYGGGAHLASRITANSWEIASVTSPQSTRLIVAAVNALPALLAVAEAAQNYVTPGPLADGFDKNALREALSKLEAIP